MTDGALVTVPTGLEAFIARQPVFDRQKRVYGYELLFRSGIANVFDHADGDQASVQVIGHSQLFGLSQLTGGKRAFINFTRDTLVQGYATVLPADAIVVEILEDVPPDDDVIAASRQLKAAGYVLALDDFLVQEVESPLVRLADIIKVDFRATPPEARQALGERLRAARVQLLAEKVETAGEFEEAAAAGYAYFQGYFFSEPVILSQQDIPAFKLTHLELLREVNRAVLDRERVEALIKREVALLYKLLRLLNSAVLGLRRRVDSVAHALAILGDVAIRKWLSIITLGTVASDRPLELAVQSVVRGSFCESLAAGAGLAGRASDLFLLGLFSLLDAMIGRPLHEILEGIAVAEDVRRALLGDPNPLRAVYLCATAYERGDWSSFSQHARQLGLDERTVPALYLQSLEHATAVTAD